MTTLCGLSELSAPSAAEDNVDDNGDDYYDGAEDALTKYDMQHMLDRVSEEEFLCFK